jgi:hypothetical protein
MVVFGLMTRMIFRGPYKDTDNQPLFFAHTLPSFQ